MVKPARGRIAQLLSGHRVDGVVQRGTSAPGAGVTLSVAGLGPGRLPVGAAAERKLVSVARPAMFGLGEETLTDPSVRDTWELTAEQVSLGGEWERLLEEALVEVHEGLGLARGARLRAELHALLVYGPDQFFMPHQDSEKDDEMVATLVVSLPSVHTGGLGRRRTGPAVSARLRSPRSSRPGALSRKTTAHGATPTTTMTTKTSTTAGIPPPTTSGS